MAASVPPQAEAEQLRQRVAAGVSEAAGTELEVRCTQPSRWVIFGRSGNAPQNAHYDTVASEGRPVPVVRCGVGVGHSHER